MRDKKKERTAPYAIASIVNRTGVRFLQESQKGHLADPRIDLYTSPFSTL